MHVLVATDGQLDPTAVARFAAPLAGTAGRVTVLTVVEIPRTLLNDLRSVFGGEPDRVTHSNVESVTLTPATDPPRGWPGDDAIIQRYLDDKRQERCKAVVAALEERGVATTSRVVEGGAAPGILQVAREESVDVIVVGSHGAGLFEGLLGSTGTKITRLAKRPVLLLRTDG